MPMESNNFKISYEVLDRDGNGQRVTFEQLGLGYEKLLELQGKAVFPMVQAFTAVTAAWHGQAVAETMGKAPTATATALSTPTTGKPG